DLRCVSLPNERLARHRLPRCGLCFALDFLSRSENTVSCASAMGIRVDFSLDPGAVAHLGTMAFPALFSLCQIRMAGTPARAHGSDTRFLRRARLSICDPARGVVVSMVDCVAARCDFCLAPCYPPVGN